MNLAAVWMPLEMALVWKLWLGISEVRGRVTTKRLRLSSVDICGRFSSTADDSAVTRQLRGAPDQGVGREELGAGIHFQGEGPRQESCSQGREDREGFMCLFLFVKILYMYTMYLIHTQSLLHLSSSPNGVSADQLHGSVFYSSLSPINAAHMCVAGGGGTHWGTGNLQWPTSP